jgi:hypothetical protein
VQFDAFLLLHAPGLPSITSGKKKFGGSGLVYADPALYLAVAYSHSQIESVFFLEKNKKKSSKLKEHH